MYRKKIRANEQPLFKGFKSWDTNTTFSTSALIYSLLPPPQILLFSSLFSVGAAAGASSLGLSMPDSSGETFLAGWPVIVHFSICKNLINEAK